MILQSLLFCMKFICNTAARAVLKDRSFVSLFKTFQWLPISLRKRQEVYAAKSFLQGSMLAALSPLPWLCSHFTVLHDAFAVSVHRTLLLSCFHWLFLLPWMFSQLSASQTSVPILGSAVTSSLRSTLTSLYELQPDSLSPAYITHYHIIYFIACPCPRRYTSPEMRDLCLSFTVVT